MTLIQEIKIAYYRMQDIQKKRKEKEKQDEEIRRKLVDKLNADKEFKSRMIVIK
jgi:hypothetical protein